MSASRLSNLPVLDLVSALDPDTLTAWLSGQFAVHEARREELLAAYKRFLLATVAGIQAEDLAARATDFANQIRSEIRHTETTRVRIKAPVLAAQRLIDGAGGAITGPLLTAAVEVEARLANFLRWKETEMRRLAAEEAARAEMEAARLAQEAEETGDNAVLEQAIGKIAEQQAAEARAEGKAADLSRVRTANDAMSSLRDHWTYVVEDIRKVPVELLAVDDAMIRAMIKAGRREIPGLIIRNEPRVTVR